MKVTRLFLRLDAGSTGSITQTQFEELKQGLQDIGSGRDAKPADVQKPAISQKPQQPRKADSEYNEIDANQDGLLTIEEIIDHFSDWDEMKVTKLFIRLDENQTGYINQDQFQQLKQQFEEAKLKNQMLKVPDIKLQQKAAKQQEDLPQQKTKNI